jgi:formate-dependent nitrite reductase membrane component NrfD
VRGLRGSGWRHVLTGLAMQTGRHAAAPGSRGVPLPVRRDGNGAQRPRRRGEQPMVPEAEFSSYYGRPVIQEPVWRTPDVPGYFFLGGLAGASSVLAAGAHLSGYRKLARVGKIGAVGAISLSAAALVHDLGRPERFVNMLRVFKPSSPMSVGSWLLAAYGPVAGAAAVSEVTGILPGAGRAATLGAGLLGSGVATYTAALICDTAVPAWHEAHREMPYVFAGSAASAAGGLGLLAVHPAEAEPARDLAVLGATVELIAKRQLLARLGDLAEPYETGTTGAILRLAEFLTAGALAGAVLGGRSRAISALSGASLVAASAMTRYGIFEAGMASARDPKYTIVPQRRRRDGRGMNSRPALLSVAVTSQVTFPGSVLTTSSIFSQRVAALP